MDDLLIGYALKALPPDETAAVERLVATDPTAEAKLARLRGLLEPLAADADVLPPPGLAVDAIGRVAAHIVEHKLPLEDAPVETTPAALPASADSGDFEELPPVPARALPVRRWVELAATAAIVLLAVGLLTTGIIKARHENAVAACKNQMMSLHGGLNVYADAHDDQFPRVGTDTRPKAGVFLSELSPAGLTTVAAVCPAGRTDDLTRAAYVYTLGYQDHGHVLPLRRHMDGVSPEVMPVLADLPAPAASPHAGPVSPHGRGQNILYTDGHVRYSLVSTVGPDGDDIYRNQDGRVKAGLHSLDASLGRATDVP